MMSGFVLCEHAVAGTRQASASGACPQCAAMLLTQGGQRGLLLSVEDLQ